MALDTQFWDKIAESYARQPVANPQAFERKIAMTVEHMSPTDIVLDVGCGTGSLALRLAPHAAHVHGLDISGEMVRIARDKARAQGTTNVTFHQGTLDTAHDFQKDSLDGICAYSILHLVRERRETLERIFHLLKPGGFFISSTTCLGDSRVPYRPLLWLMKALGKAPWVAVFSGAALEDEIKNAGFVEVKVVDVGAQPSIAFILARRPIFEPT